VAIEEAAEAAFEGGQVGDAVDDVGGGPDAAEDGGPGEGVLVGELGQASRGQDRGDGEARVVAVAEGRVGGVLGGAALEQVLVVVEERRRHAEVPDRAGPAAGGEDAIDLGQAALEREPVEGLRGGDEVDRRGGEAGGGGLARGVADAGGGGRVGEHVGVGIDADRVEAAGGEQAGEDAGAAAEVGGAGARGEARGRQEPVEDRAGIGRAEAVVAGGDGAEALARVFHRIRTAVSEW
jgi:hypothetical protein